MTAGSNRVTHPSRRAVIAGGAAALGANLLAQPAAALTKTAGQPPVAPDRPPDGYNILFILVDQEHFFDPWPFPVPGREWIRQNAITFSNHQAASCVCSPARSTIYVGEHIQHTGIFDNLNSLLAAGSVDQGEDHRPPHRGARLLRTYQGKWHLSANLDVVAHAIDAPFPKYRETIQSYGFDDFFGVGDISDGALGGYTYDDATTAAVASWLRTKGASLKSAGQPWFLAVNFVNPHDAMYVNSDLPDQNVQGKHTTHAIFRPPHDEIYDATWDDVPLPASAASLSTRPDARRGSSSTRISRIFWSARGRTRTGAGVAYATIITTASATATGRSSPCSTRSSRPVRTRTPSSSSARITASSAAITRCAARATAPTASRTTCRS